jgi:hypothetical protein
MFLDVRKLQEGGPYTTDLQRNNTEVRISKVNSMGFINGIQITKSITAVILKS